MGSAHLLVVMASAEKILFDLLPDYYDQLLPFYSGDQHIKEFCENRCLENKDLINLKIAVASVGAIIEVANIVMGAKEQEKGAKHAEMSFSRVIETLEKQDSDIDHLRSAYGFLEQAENYLRLGHYKQLTEALGKVNTSATYALHTSGTNKVDDLVMAAKLLILVDVFSQSLTITKDKEIKLVPINNLQSSKRGNMIIHVTSHLQRLRKILNKKGLPMDSLRRVLTLIYQSDDNVKLDETYDKCAMWVAPKTEIVSEDTMIVSLPPLNIIPEADGDSFAILSFLGENGSSKHALSLCIEERYEYKSFGHKFLNMGYFGIIYSLPLLRINPEDGNTKYAEDDEIIEVKIQENRITYTSVESMLERYLLINYRDMTDMESGDVKSVKCLALCYEPRYTIGDMKEAKKIVGVAKSLYLSGASMRLRIDHVIIMLGDWSPGQRKQ